MTPIALTFTTLALLNALAQCQTARLEVVIVADTFPDDTSFSLSSMGTNGTDQPTVLYDGDYRSACGDLPYPGTYMLQFNDAFGDGICCDNGNGRIEVRIDGTTVFTNDGRFAESISTTITLDSNGVPSASGAPGGAPTESLFNIQLIPAAGFDPATQPAAVTALQLAVQRWQEVIVGDVPDIQLQNGETVDDLQISYDFSPIDGPGQIIGQAGPRSFRRTSGIPVTGVMQFDSEDIGGLNSAQMQALFLHEMGHILGIGTLWSAMGCSTCDQNANPQYNAPGQCPSAELEFQNFPGYTPGSILNIELDGGAGTRCGHFDEIQFRSELMTGYLTTNPQTGISELSRMTVGTLEDLGYQVNYDVANPYTIPAGNLYMDPPPEDMNLGFDILLPDMETVEYYDAMDEVEMECVEMDLGGSGGNGGRNGGLNTGAIIGIAAGGIGVAIVGAIFFVKNRRRKDPRDMLIGNHVAMI